jgi:alpha-tubulin suppressor-like RCC1 family protein
VTVQGITNATSVSAGQNVTCASLASHVAECWGFGAAGALGNGTQIGSDVPVQVSGLTDVASVTAGYAMGCALRVGGGVDCWGGDVYGQLGNGAGGAGARGFSAFPLAVSAP